MKIIDVSENDNVNYYTKKMTLDENIQINSLINFLKQFETEEVKLSVCYCSTFDEDGHPLYRQYNTVDDIVQILELPSPYVNFSIDFYNTNTNSYAFSLLTSVNSNVLTYVIDKKKKGILLVVKFLSSKKK